MRAGRALVFGAGLLWIAAAMGGTAYIFLYAQLEAISESEQNKAVALEMLITVMKARASHA